MHGENRRDVPVYSFYNSVLCMSLKAYYSAWFAHVGQMDVCACGNTPRGGYLRLQFFDPSQALHQGLNCCKQVKKLRARNGIDFR